PVEDLRREVFETEADRDCRRAEQREHELTREVEREHAEHDAAAPDDEARGGAHLGEEEPTNAEARAEPGGEAETEADDEPCARDDGERAEEPADADLLEQGKRGIFGRHRPLVQVSMK